MAVTSTQKTPLAWAQPSSAGNRQQLHCQVPEAATVTDWYLELPNNTGCPLRLPLGSTPTGHQQTAANPGANLLLCVQLKWNAFPATFCARIPENTKISDIAHFPQWLRQLIYAELMQQPVWPEPWYTQLSQPLQALVQDSFRPQYHPALRDGWLYIFSEEQGWREIHVTENGLSEVNLILASGQDQRTASGLPQPGLILVAYLNGQPRHYQIAFSEQQWSWARLQYLQQHRSELTSSRWQTIDMVALLNSPQPTLYVDDPWRLVRRAQADLTYTWLVFSRQVELITQKPFFDSAVFANQLFFNRHVKPHEYADTPTHLAVPHSPVIDYQLIKRSSPTHTLYQAARFIDRNLLDELLETQSRQQQHRLIAALQTQLAALLLAENNTDYTTAIDLVITDFFAASLAQYGQAFIEISHLFSLLLLNPNQLDYGFAADDPPASNMPTMVQRYFSHVMNEANGLTQSWLPTDSAVDIYHATLRQQPWLDRPPYCENDGSGRFRLWAFAQLTQANIQHIPLLKITEPATTTASLPHDSLSEELARYKTVYVEIPAMFEYAIAGIIAALDKLSLNVKDAPHTLNVSSTPHFTLIAAAKLAKATGYFPNLTLEQGLQPQPNRITLGLMTLTQSSTAPATLHSVKKTAVPIYHALESTPQGMASHTLNSGIISPQATISPQTREQLRQIPFIQLQTTQPPPSPLPKNEARWLQTTLQSLGLTQSLLTVITSLLALHNVKQATFALIDQHSETTFARRILEQVGAFSALMLALNDLGQLVMTPAYWQTFIHQHQALRYFFDDPAMYYGLLATRMEHAVYILSLLGLIFVVTDIMQAVYHRDLAQASGSTISLLGNLILLGSQAGQHLQTQGSHILSQQWRRQLRRIGRKKLLSQLLLSRLLQLQRYLIWLTPYAWVGVSLIILGAFISVWLRDDALTRWAKFGPFGRSSRQRLSGKYRQWKQPGQEHFACQTLMNLILAPNISQISRVNPESTPPLLRVDVTLAQFVPGTDTLDLRAEWQYQIIPHFRDTNAVQWLPCARAIPWKIIQITDESGHVTMMQYFFRFTESLPGSDILETIRVRLIAKVRLLTGQHGFIFPCSEFPTTKTTTHDYIDPKQPGWAYSGNNYLWIHRHDTSIH